MCGVDIDGDPKAWWEYRLGVPTLLLLLLLKPEAFAAAAGVAAEAVAAEAEAAAGLLNVMLGFFFKLAVSESVNCLVLPAALPLVVVLFFIPFEALRFLVLAAFFGRGEG